MRNLQEHSRCRSAGFLCKPSAQISIQRTSRYLLPIYKDGGFSWNDPHPQSVLEISSLPGGNEDPQVLWQPFAFCGKNFFLMIRVLEVNRASESVQVTEYLAEQAVSVTQRPDATTLRWIDVTSQGPKDIEILRKGFQFHALTLEDCLRFDQRPKLEEYPGIQPYIFVVIHNFCAYEAKETPSEDSIVLSKNSRRIGSERFALRLQEVHAYLGPNYLVTIHQQPLPEIDLLWKRLQTDAALFQKGCDFLYYLIADGLCDSNFPILDHLSDELDEIEELVISTPEKRVLSLIYETRKVLVAMRRALSPQRDLMALLARHGGGSFIQPNTALYFRDVYDHLVRINEAIESGRDLLGNCVDAYLSAVGQRTNEIMKQLTILSAVMLPLTFIVGFFGMNFQFLPFASSAWFVLALILMFIILPGGMIYWFHRRRWL